MRTPCPALGPSLTRTSISHVTLVDTSVPYRYCFKKLETATWTFGHEAFVRERQELLVNITRKGQKDPKNGLALHGGSLAGDTRPFFVVLHRGSQWLCNTPPSSLQARLR